MTAVAEAGHAGVSPSRDGREMARNSGCEYILEAELTVPADRLDVHEVN